MALPDEPPQQAWDPESLVIRKVWLDERGLLQQSVEVTTVSLEQLQAKAISMRQSMNLFFLSMGWELVDVQVEVPDRRVIMDRRRRTRGDRRGPLSPDDSAFVPLMPDPPPEVSGKVIIKHFGKREAF